jgi:organic hydroperoxide reductase OsmC/OhrA
MKTHHYALELNWTGNTGAGTKTYAGYSRNHEFFSTGKPVVPGSSDPSFRGDPKRYNPEELLLAAIANCHMLWYLHFCSENKITVTHYTDQPTATMQEETNGAGKFTEAVLHPQVTISNGDAGLAHALHDKAHEFCFVAQSLNFPVKCDAAIVASDSSSARSN